MAKRNRRSAVDLVSGGEESPLAKKMRAQKEAAAAARAADTGTDVDTAVVDEPEPAPVPTPRREPQKVPSPANKPPPRRSGVAERRASANFEASKITKRVQVSREEARHWVSACEVLSQQVGAEVTYSVACRTLMALLVEAQDGLEKVRAPQLRRPANGDTLGFADFEAQLAEYLSEVLQIKRR